MTVMLDPEKCSPKQKVGPSIADAHPNNLESLGDPVMPITIKWGRLMLRLPVQLIRKLMIQDLLVVL